MSEKTLSLINQKVEALAKKANLSRIPRVKLSKSDGVAEARFSGDITISLKWLRKWETGEIDEIQVDAVIAHEIGHLMDFKRYIRSVFFKSVLSVLTYAIFLFLALYLLDLGLYSSKGSMSWVGFLLIFFVWLIFFPYVARSSGSNAQFEADRYACQLIGAQNMAQSFARRIEQCYTLRSKDSALIKTLDQVFHLIYGPSLVERLEQINFEVANAKLEIRQKELQESNGK